MTTASVHSLLKKYGIRPKKNLGQHFLAAMPTIEKIVAALGPDQNDCVIEIGSGLGIMTRLIAKQAGRVIAIERDHALLDIARKELADIKNIAWIEGDVLKQKISELCCDKNCRFKIAGNLPYNISSPILFWMLDQRSLISSALIMLQKEVAVRIAAKPGNKDYGILSVLTQAFADVEKLFDVSAKSFAPPPEVTSSIVRLNFTTKAKIEPEFETRFREIVRAAFGKRRKTIRNALLGAHGLKLSADNIDRALTLASIEPKQRPETVSVEEFAILAKEL